MAVIKILMGVNARRASISWRNSHRTRTPLQITTRAYSTPPNIFDQQEKDDPEGKSSGSNSESAGFKSTAFKMFETAATTFASIAILGCVRLKTFNASSLMVLLFY
jgi:hypothetical protein